MADNATGNVATATTDTAAQQTQTQAQTDTGNKALSNEEFDRRVQSETDKRMADYGKRIAEYDKTISALRNELDEINKAKMTADERKKFDDEQKEKALAEKDRLLTERENRLTAIDELTRAKLYDGSDKANALVNLVIKGADATEIADSVKAIKSFIDEQVSKGVDETFREKGRIPNGGSKGDVTGTATTKNNIAAELGKKAAERAKGSNDVLNHYINGGK